MVLRLDVAILIRIVAIRKSLATQPCAPYGAIIDTAPFGCLVLRAQAAVEDDVDAALAVLLHCQLMLGERPRALVRRV